MPAADLAAYCWRAWPAGVMAFLANPELHRDDHALAARNTQWALSSPDCAIDQPSWVAGSRGTHVRGGSSRAWRLRTDGGDALAYATCLAPRPPKAAIHRHADKLIDAISEALRLTPEDTGYVVHRRILLRLRNSVWLPLRQVVPRSTIRRR